MKHWRSKLEGAPEVGRPFHQDVRARPSTAERPLLRRHFAPLLRSPLLLLLLLALAVRVVYLVETVGTPIWRWYFWNQSDMNTFLKGARQILDGDLLVRDPYHPFHMWHAAIAPEEQWRRWYAPHIFHQVPGYYYFLAFLLKLFGRSLTAIKVTQSLLGAAHATLLGAVGQRIMGRTGGLIVGVLAAIYGPFVVAEPMILREGLGLLMATLGFFLVLRALERSAHDRCEGVLLSWLAAGVALGLGALTKETGFVLFAAVWLWTFGRSFWGRHRPRQFAAIILLAGFAIGLSPLIVRNAAVGASPLDFTPQGGVNFIIGNAADSPSRGVCFQIFPSFKVIMERSEGRLLPSIVATLRMHGQHPGLFLANMWAKFSAIWSSFEQPDNFNYEYLKMHSILLRGLPRFVCVWLPAALGLMLLTARWLATRAAPSSARRMPSQDRLSPSIAFSREILVLLLAILAAHAFAQSLLPVMSRYRLVIVPFLMLPAGWALAQGLTWFASKRWFASAGMSLGICALVVLWLFWPANPDLQRAVRRLEDFRVGAEILLRQNDVSGARTEFERGLAYGRLHAASARESEQHELAMRRARVLLFTSYNHFPEVQGEWQILRQILPQDPAIQDIQPGLFQQEKQTAPEPDEAAQLPGERRGKTD